MKNFLTSLLVLTLITFFSGKASAQNLKVGGGLFYATDLNNVGISVNGNYEFSKQLQLAPSFIYFLTKDYVSWKALDIDLHYKLVDNSGLDIYAIGGLGLTFVSIDIPTITLGGSSFGGGSVSDSNFGVNVGAGVSKSLGSVDLFAEAKYAITSGSYLKIGAGLLFGF